MPSLVGSEMCIRDRTGTGPPNHDDSAPRLRLPLSHCHADLPVTPYERMTMLAPRWTTSRSARRLDGLWDFAFDACSLGVTEQWWCDRLPDSRPMPVPASYNDLVVDRGEREYVGDVWYQTRVVVPAGARGRRGSYRHPAATLPTSRCAQTWRPAAASSTTRPRSRARTWTHPIPGPVIRPWSCATRAEHPSQLRRAPSGRSQ